MSNARNIISNANSKYLQVTAGDTPGSCGTGSSTTCPEISDQKCALPKICLTCGGKKVFILKDNLGNESNVVCCPRCYGTGQESQIAIQPYVPYQPYQPHIPWWHGTWCLNIG